MERQELDVRTLWQALRRSWRTIFLCLLVGILGGVALTAVTAKQYQASSSVLLRRAGDTGNTPEGDMATEVAIANSVPVASRAQVALGIDEPIEVFLKRYTATAQTDDVLVFLSTAGTPDEAVAVANTLAEEFLAYRREQDTENVEVLRRSLADRVAQLQTQIADYDEQIAELEQSTPVAAGSGPTPKPASPRPARRSCRSSARSRAASPRPSCRRSSPARGARSSSRRHRRRPRRSPTPASTSSSACSPASPSASASWSCVR